MIVIQVMCEGAIGLRAFIHTKKIFPLFFVELNFNLVVNAKIKPELVVQLPAKLVRLQSALRYRAALRFQKNHLPDHLCRALVSYAN